MQTEQAQVFLKSLNTEGSQEGLSCVSVTPRASSVGRREVTARGGPCLCHSQSTHLSKDIVEGLLCAMWVKPICVSPHAGLGK